MQRALLRAPRPHGNYAPLTSGWAEECGYPAPAPALGSGLEPGMRFALREGGKTVDSFPEEPGEMAIRNLMKSNGTPPHL